MHKLTLILLLCLPWPLPAATHRLTINDRIGRDWADEPITWTVVCQAGEWDGKNFLLSRDGQPITGQARVTDTHDDDSAKLVTVRFVIDHLQRDASTEVVLDTGAAGTNAPGVWVDRGKTVDVLRNAYTGVRLPAAGQMSGPILGVQLPSGRWTGQGRYECERDEPFCTALEIIEEGPVYVEAKVTVSFDVGGLHTMTVGLWAGSRSIDIDETFDVAPVGKYSFRRYGDDEDELAWEWWQWYGQQDGLTERHPSYWILSLNSPSFQATRARYGGEHSATDAARKDRPEGYPLTYAAAQLLEKYIVGMSQWRPDGVTWYLAAADNQPDSDCLGIYTHSVRHWRNPNVYPLPEGITLRTGANDMRLFSEAEGRALELYAPIGLGRRRWAIRPSTWAEALAPRDAAPTALQAERVQRHFGLDITRDWVTDWKMDNRYPRLFVKPGGEAEYLARFKGAETGGNWGLMGFLRQQDRASFEQAWQRGMDQADKMVAGYFSDGPYPGWMLGYWHGIIVAAHVDTLVGSEFCTPEQARELKKKLAILTYALVSKDQWPDKQINYGWGSMNMPVGRWGGLVTMASALSDHPAAWQAPELPGPWLRNAKRYFTMLLETEFAADGTHKSCPHYIGASSTSFYVWALQGDDVGEHPVMQRFARYYMQLMKPVDPRWGIRVLLNEGDTRPGSSPMPAILARIFADSDPQLAGELMQLWIDGGRDLTQGMGIPDAVIIDQSIAPRQPQFRSEVYPGFGAFLRQREYGTAEESYLAFIGGNFMIDHANADQFAFSWHEKGVPLTVFNGSMYNPSTITALSHNTIAWDVVPGGQPDPGEGQPGNWYHDHRQPYVDLGGKTPTRHWQIGWSQEVPGTINDTRGMVTLGRETAAAALLEGQVEIKALAEYPTRPDNYALAIQPNAWPPASKLSAPFTWTRRLLYVRAPQAAGMNYLVIRDAFGAGGRRTPYFSYWALAEGVEIDGSQAHFDGALGVDTEMVVLQPAAGELVSDSFTNTECEPIVRAKGFKSERYTLCRVTGQADQGFLVVIFPRGKDEPRPVVTSWADGAGVAVSWRDETHHVVLDVREHTIELDGIAATASAFVVKQQGDDASLALLSGTTLAAAGMSLTESPGAIDRGGGQRRQLPVRELMPPPSER